MEVYEAPRSQSRADRGDRRRVFTLEHANRTLPLVKRIVADMVKQFKLVCSLEDRCHMRRPRVTQEEHQAIRKRYEVELDNLRDLCEELAAVGCELKDWRRGLIDFLSTRDGRQIELCWQLGEDKIEHWHEVGAGFAGRQPLDVDSTQEAVTQS